MFWEFEKVLKIDGKVERIIPVVINSSGPAMAMHLKKKEIFSLLLLMVFKLLYGTDR